MITGYSVFLFAAATVTGLLAAYTGWYRRREISSATGILLLLIAITLYIGGAGMELASSDLAEILFWVKVEYLGIASIPSLLLIGMFGYVNRTRHLSLPLLALLSVIPVITCALVLTQSPLFYQTVGIDTSAPFPRLVFTPGPGYYLNACYQIIALFTGTILLVRAYRRSTQPLYRKQIQILGIGITAPFIASILYISGLSPIPHLDLAPFALVITATAFTIGIFSYQLFDLVPIAHSVILQKIPVGVMVVDDLERVTEVNPAAEAALGLGTGEGIGQPVALLTERFPELAGIIRDARPGIKKEVRYGDRHYTFEVVRLGEEGDRPAGSVLLIRDISPWRLAEEELLRRTDELKVANQQLALISAITRHDISNQLVVIDGYLDLLLEDGMPADQAKTVEQVLDATDRVREMVTFMRDYQAIGTSAPVWTDLRNLPERAATEVALRGVQINNLLPAIEVLADPLIEKVLATLFENAIRHGKTVTQILLSARTDQAGLTIVCEDDGAGVNEDKKERIFERGYGSNTGLGLFLAREILAITGMTITETGIPGVGARFEIQVPPGRYRTLDQAKKDHKEEQEQMLPSGAGSDGPDTPA
ncbi:histidine kinase N-terminal 7TM domain-containing protein [Methanosphaerula palustris]|uniref:histidine kinase n=1 Tax=Methanosphaerula palustris (strain ATCC BAA-1556 / DSM 19958 / E1-9c) TaxID=521011 RepID=B8GE49_METPE|nr:histidine kinase N-terminal 7TM domain-containing protein [Methanosphaerula palustris]ACL17550.1 PAS/PAC sensor signal transduction histidine kinase [Methanosphaerula palustris E1-9c]